MGDKNLNELLKWSIEHTPTSGANADSTTTAAAAPSENRSNLTPEALAALMGGPSDADLMMDSMAAIVSRDPEISLESKLTAFDNLEQLIESLDNANLLSKLGLWTPLLECLAHEEAEIRLMAAWCVGTAVQNNEPCQERLVALGGVEKLVRMAVGERLPPPPPPPSDAPAVSEGEGDKKKNEEKEGDETKETKDVRRKAIYALSSAVRNYQPAMDVCAAELRRQGHGEHVGDDDKVIDATDMDAVDAVINGLKDEVTSA
ncbi:Fes1-domain-containing protein [Xylariaceae sp. AK1471]|nr:Fes1-domain-containing protein [Xylariaceae sp. AK1471]